MKFAVFGDIHGNIEALRAAYQEALSAKAEKIYHLGDLGGYSPFVNEVVEFLIEHHIEGVQGNYDETVANDREHCGCKYEDPVQEEMANRSFEWTKQHAVSEDQGLSEKAAVLYFLYRRREKSPAVPCDALEEQPVLV